MTAVDLAPVRPFERKLPPVVGVAMLSLAMAVTGGVILAAQAQSTPSVALPMVIEIVAVALELVAVVMTLSIRPFAWLRFRQVFAVALVAYVIQAGMIEWAFAKNHTPAGPLTALTLGIVVFATIVPLMIAFTTARYQAVPARD
jgi:hypothetical protein